MRAGLRSALREATAEVHASAESEVDLRADIGSYDGYRRFLHVMHATTIRFAAPLDRSSCMSGIEPRSHGLVDALGEDLESSCWEWAIQRDSTSSLCPAAITDYSDAWAIGVGYTLEGSSLGATVLRRRAPVDAPTDYLDTLLAARRTRWTHFSRWLDDPRQSEYPTDEIVAGAVAVFLGVHTAIDALATPTNASGLGEVLVT